MERVDPVEFKNVLEKRTKEFAVAVFKLLDVLPHTFVRGGRRMIKSLRIRNFKSYRDATLRMSRVTFMIGANGAGKSNALDALRFVNWMGHGERLDDIDTRLGSGPWKADRCATCLYSLLIQEGQAL